MIVAYVLFVIFFLVGLSTVAGAFIYALTGSMFLAFVAFIIVAVCVLDMMYSQ